VIKKILIANRGEIAVRLLRACRELKIASVAIFSEADRQALHVRYADEAYLLGPAPARDSYLRGEAIIDIARKCGADAIHPGYGFLAERADFAEACVDAGMTFIGPKASSIAAMGDKAVARATVARAGIPVIPGTEGEGSLTDEELLAIAPRIGFPLLIKASAGGGGKGMREVTTREKMPDLIHAARREAESAFGDGNVYLEKVVKDAHHIEFQILADQHGNVIHLGERECSIQRRHQKLIEEAPSPFIGDDAELRKKMGRIAVQAARAVEYLNAGTIEFLVDREKRFYFLEMNTRLQVEHAVTEACTGVDIVAEQIRIARGQSLSYSQDEIRLAGAGIECRINAEDPYKEFLPSTGRITHISMPTGPGVRIDTGVYPGFDVSLFYDALICKLITWGDRRAQAILRMRRALEEYLIVGVRTNIPFHQAMMDLPSFNTGEYDTRFVENSFSTSSMDQGQDVYPEIAALMATLAADHAKTALRPSRQERKNSWKWAGR
jgi:acetyl-CoA carboxylase biotin carboxylase subunit